MIQITEYRIGNYVFVDNEMQKICLISSDPGFAGLPGIGYKQNNKMGYEKSNSERLRPVPLTDSLLQDFGFVFHTHFKLWQQKKSLTTIIPSNWTGSTQPWIFFIVQ